MQALDVKKPPSMSNLSRASIIGSSNGLICVQSTSFSSLYTSLSLWNPATREVRKVPGIISDDDYGDLYFEFGFSPLINDYKIVKILVSDNVINRVEVYSLNADSWREIEFENLDGVQIFWDNITGNGSIFWYVYKSGEKEEGIISFDIAMEVFTLLPVPALDINSIVLKLTVHDKKLALRCHIMMGKFESSSIDFWVMEEDVDASGKKWSWTKIYNSSPHPGVLFPVLIWRNEILCVVYVMPGLIKKSESKSIISLSNLSTTETEILTICELSRVCYVSGYVESLVPVGNIHNEEPRS